MRTERCNILANALAGSAGGLVGGNSGSFSGANVDLYNARAHCDNSSCEGGTGSVLSGIGSWIADQFASAGRGAQNMGSQFAALVNANGPQGPYVDPNDLGGPGSGHPPTASGGGAVVTPPVVACGPVGCVVSPAVAVPGTAGYGAGNTTLNSGNGESGNNSLLDPNAETHVLYGDGPTSGGHLSGVGKPGKSEFPSAWSPQDITNAISDIATDPKTQWSKPSGNGYVTGTGTVNGVDIKVVVDPSKGRIVTGYPTNLPRNPK